jgi:hypothetical protein
MLRTVAAPRNTKGQRAPTVGSMYLVCTFRTPSPPLKLLAVAQSCTVMPHCPKSGGTKRSGTGRTLPSCAKAAANPIHSPALVTHRQMLNCKLDASLSVCLSARQWQGVHMHQSTAAPDAAANVAPDNSELWTHADPAAIDHWTCLHM